MKPFVKGIPFRVVQQINEINEVPKGIELIQAPKIWRETKGEGVKIAVLDTGCDINHPDLKDRIIGGKTLRMMTEAILKYSKTIMATVPMSPERLQHPKIMMV